jgi:hypothetical protein
MRVAAIGGLGRGLRALLPVLLLVACATKEAPPPPPPPPPPAPPPAAVEPEGSRVDRLCGQLRQIMQAEPGGFAALRSSPTGERQWVGRVVPIDMSFCQVEGDFFPGAEYVCHGQEYAAASGDLLLADFNRYAQDIDACLARPGWEGRGWMRDAPTAFAGGERQQVWRNGGVRLRPAIALKIEENFDTSNWFLRLNAFTFR